LYQIAYNKLAEKVETDLLEFEGSRPVEEIGNQPSLVERSAPDTDSGPTIEEPKPTGRGWVEQAIATNTDAIRGKVQALPGEKISGGGKVIDEYGTPSTDTIVENEAVMYQHCRVFEVKADHASNGNPFIKVRIGKRGESGIPGQYANARSFDAGVIKQVAFFDPEEQAFQYKIRENDYVDVWGYWKSWKNNKDKFDLELQKIQVSEEQK
jgi:hypothetical protein